MAAHQYGGNRAETSPNTLFLERQGRFYPVNGYRMFSFISQNWRGRPLLTRATIVNLIGHTKTKTGLTVRCVLDRRPYLKEVKIRDEPMQKIRSKPGPFHGEWNYAIRPE